MTSSPCGWSESGISAENSTTLRDFLFLLVLMPSRRFRRSGTGRLQDQHAIAVAVKSIALANRFRVGVEQKFAAGERADEHEQGRARQMKVRQKRIDHAKFKRRVDKQIGWAFGRDNLRASKLDLFIRAGFLCDGFHDSYAPHANRHDLPRGVH